MYKTKFEVRKGNRIFKHDVTLEVTEDRIIFVKSPFAMKDEIKAMAGPKWHGFDKEKPRKVWSVKNCPRNNFQIRVLEGHNMYDHFEQPLIEIHDFKHRGDDGYIAEAHQQDMIRRGLTYHYQIFAAEMGLGKSLTAIEIMERSGKKDWWFVGPKSALESVEEQIRYWHMDPSINVELMTYEKLLSIQKYDFDSIVLPDGVIFDESSMLKTPTAQRTIAAQWLADAIREKHGMEGYVIEMSGTPSAKKPSDWWSQCEIAWPGFLREGSLHAFEQRYGVFEEGEDADGVTFHRRTGWVENEVANLPQRYEGLATVYRKKEWLNLPDKTYHVIELDPTAKAKRVAQSLCRVAPNTITALTWTRALSSGFQYVNKPEGTKVCPVCKGSGTYNQPEEAVCPGCDGVGEIPEYKRKTVKVKTPKDDALRNLLDKAEPQGRIVIAASFKGSIARVKDICTERGWATAVVDGDGWRVYDMMGKLIKDVTPMQLWRESEGKVAFIGNPGSCRYGLTLTLACILVFYDNDFSAEKRLQMEDRIHRLSMDMTLGAHIYDLIHLPVDKLVLETLQDNKKLEHLSLGVLNETLGYGTEEVDFTEELLEAV